MQRTAGLRRPGSAARDLAYVAAGYTDGFFETGLSPWDVAAGSLLVTEAGGLIGNFTGESDFLEQRECVAGNPRIYGQLVNILRKYSKFASAGEKADLRQSTPKLIDPAAEPAGQRPEPAADAGGGSRLTGGSSLARRRIASSFATVSGRTPPVMRRAPRCQVRYDQAHSSITTSRLRKPIRKRMWMSSHAIHANHPFIFIPIPCSTAARRPMVAMLPLSR